ncbi:ribosome biogenesis protein BMS1 homolog isoform X1 [Papaver somniferum]|uniref:ribosome biogenesis protein BMS1 homolog isoform X1 n=1 Tax=Papaver somniferum TaxID=3469 RepID=UPI000E6FFA64|nr:ribosome biogenesis protein BMS1 homolog isoform X1 [Papaver somniferum]
MNGMIDAAKYADAVMLLIDAKYGFEMETFEFLNLLQVHGVPKAMGVLTYLDKLKDEDRRTTTKTRLMQKFREYIYEGAHIFCLSSFHDDKYQESDIEELADFLLIEEFPILPCRAKHPYMLVDRHEDVPSSSEAHVVDNGKRNVILHGYLRGCDIMKGTKETFEFLNLLQVHGVPKAMGVLAYLDKLKDEDRRTTTKTRLMQKFREYIYEGAHIFCLSSFHDDKYQESDIEELADFLLIGEFPILPCRAKHPYMLVDRHEDVPSSSEAHVVDNGKRNVILHGYLRGCDIMKGTKVHIAGVGDYHLADVTISADPLYTWHP